MVIWVTLQRSKTAREAVKTIDHLLQTYGYSSSGESFSIGDTKEAWLMEIYPKGTELGAVWVASSSWEDMGGKTNRPFSCDATERSSLFVGLVGEYASALLRSSPGWLATRAQGERARDGTGD